MNRKKELKQQYQEVEIIAGVYQIKNNENGKVFIASTPNLKTINGVKFSLENNVFNHKELQQDWNHFGKNAFSIEILEKLKKDESDPYFNMKEALKELEEKWLEKLQPFGENGYH
ncbi:LuxR family transcriptional regulator [Ureibacillus massiliensis 4400831 = CIP 108448 = CCUG 49529]|uniref:LuxR family transcriptional regulator n=1 Tax=Ureibacillus massiliensis 4400831 = CIP 108448 = CCUG 49529 TaxID=1211035 RepID=A0A0A3IZT0_9BACL|nr:GIY-YIG nuclease family protein [Ureibacillus massiliensis]KGR90216.1 LuxR family transcriptional regulator [Ureibacillus massiliensis 4400831 = CIP 108448 = CCUG 49529]